MNLHTASASRPAGTLSTAGLTLPEMMIAVAIFAFVVTGVISANLFGLRMFQITENKLTASDSARAALGKMTTDIRNCKSTLVGNVTSNGTFVAIADGVAQAGSGLIIYPTTNTTNFIIYFLNDDNTFRRTTSVSNTTVILAKFITNTVVFRAQDFLGNVLTNTQNNRVIYLNLECYQPKRHAMVADYYKLETAVTRRAR